MGRLTTLGARVGALGPRVRPPVKLADPFYQTRGWRQFASLIKSQRGYVCEECAHDGRKTPWLIHADHITEIKDGGAALDPLNIMLRCQPCHNRKTSREAMRRAREG